MLAISEGHKRNSTIGEVKAVAGMVRSRTGLRRNHREQRQRVVKENEICSDDLRAYSASISSPLNKALVLCLQKKKRQSGTTPPNSYTSSPKNLDGSLSAVPEPISGTKPEKQNAY